ncbi:hypothetical protein [Serinicoccus kebangsaanensis]|uniref:hypothetical protein n=1 Tax=Serinicoccus kebangsaanensis TaxID=2602069 RepID=UPI00178C3AC7|nr:hypothetical protein [Serinicoccus kebangsaanensis]
MAKQASIGEWYCPGCGGSGRPVGDTHEQWCMVCGGRGTVNWDPDKQQSGEINPLDIATDGRLWAIGVRNMAAAAVLLVIVGGLGLAVMITSTWLQVGSGPLRGLAEILPESLVARTPEGQGRPWVVGLLVFAPFLVAAVVATVAARREARTGRGMQTLAWTLGRATAVVIGLATAVTLAAIATGADLTPPGDADSYVGVGSGVPEGFAGPVLRTDTWWAFAVVAGVVVVWAWWSQWRLGRRARRAGLAAGTEAP